MDRKPTTGGLVGTYVFGLSGCWGRRGLDVSAMGGLLWPQKTVKNVRTIQTFVPHVCVLLHRTRNSTVLRPFYVFKIRCAGTKQQREVLISYRNALRLYSRFTERCGASTSASVEVNCSEDNAQTSSSSVFGNPNEKNVQGFDVGTSSVNTLLMPGQKDKHFLKSLWATIQRKYNSGGMDSGWTVNADLYALWRATCSVTVELFASSINESGVAHSYCSLDVEDTLFSSSGRWADVEGNVKGAAGNPPFETGLIDELLLAFEKGVRKESPYCRCVLLPLGKRYGVHKHINSLSTEGIKLVTIEAGGLPFRNDWHLLSLETTKPKAYGYQRLGLFVWRNRRNLLKNPVPRDVESTYMRWTVRALTDPLKATLDLSAFKKAFPLELRSDKLVSSIFEV